MKVELKVGEWLESSGLPASWGCGVRIVESGYVYRAWGTDVAAGDNGPLDREKEDHGEGIRKPLGLRDVRTAVKS